VTTNAGHAPIRSQTGRQKQLRTPQPHAALFHTTRPRRLAHESQHDGGRHVHAARFSGNLPRQPLLSAGMRIRRPATVEQPGGRRQRNPRPRVHLSNHGNAAAVHHPCVQTKNNTGKKSYATTSPGFSCVG